MKRFLTKALFCAIAALMLASTAFAANGEMDNMVFVGYDVAMYADIDATIDGVNDPVAPDWHAPKKVYKEVINGKETGKIVTVAVPFDWQFEGYEAVYPYAGYYRLYVEGNKLNITDYVGDLHQNEGTVFAQWQTKRVDYMWQMAYPYTVWERQQTLVNGTNWTWDFGNPEWAIVDTAVLKPTNKKATITDVTWDTYGFGKYNNAGKLLKPEEIAMYDYFEVENALVNLEAVLNVADLSARDANGKYVLSDAEIAAKIPVVFSKNITAKFNKEGTDGLTTKDIAVEWLAHSNWADWDNGIAKFTCNLPACGCHNQIVKSAKVANPCGYATCTCENVLANATTPDACSFYIDYTAAKIEWSPVYYELAAPYKQYQTLIVNGVALDGTADKEFVFRYTGGCATPVIEWKFAFYQAADGRYVEQRYVDGIPEVDAYGNGVYRISEPVHDNSYQTPEGTTGTISLPGNYNNMYNTGNYFFGF